MGQYYKPIIIDDNRKPLMAFYSHEFGNGLKLMEHSYLDNNFVNVVVNTMANKFKKGCRLVWAGDYAENEKGQKQNLYEMVSDDLYCKKGNQHRNYKIRYIINKTKGEFVDLWQLPTFNGSTVHPLPILCSDGNGQGGGDYWGHNENMAGRWSGDVIMFGKWGNWKDNLNNNGFYPKYGGTLKEITPNFAELYDIKDGFVNALKFMREMVEAGEMSREDIASLVKQAEVNIPNLNGEEIRRVFYKKKSE